MRLFLHDTSNSTASSNVIIAITTIIVQQRFWIVCIVHYILSYFTKRKISRFLKIDISWLLDNRIINAAAMRACLSPRKIVQQFPDDHNAQEMSFSCVIRNLYNLENPLEKNQKPIIPVNTITNASSIDPYKIRFIVKYIIRCQLQSSYSCDLLNN